MKKQHSPRHIAPKKSLGQHFLTDKNIIRNIIAALQSIPEDTVVEIGPGEGALTALLIEQRTNSLTAIEFDHRAVEMLQSTFPSDKYPHFTLHEGDVRSFPLVSFARDHYEQYGRKIKVIGNIPYNITSDILFWLYEAAPFIEKAIIMLQKEVAERLVARPRTKDYGILTIASALVADIRILFHVSPNCFFPKPAVTSSVIEIRFTADHHAMEQYHRVKPLVDAAFNQRRKVLANALHNYIASRTPLPATEIIERANAQGISYFRKRAEELTPADFCTLAETLHAIIQHSRTESSD